ncbi:MAG TPA: DUF1810 domain-containing protein [Methylibium sp.]|uniref:DUF1810 domain-containing protein n=1 Tax=Methylibium sp. TaxID=2067992 RepID=UPI002DBDE827|nr:DUF1810 domain-containing protein [Methylibium sp.]HEU4460865.1 DUF1810 domain-containing protein [Methylibium sp.]
MDTSPSLERFVQAQEPVFDAVRQELRAGRKRTHWMWFIFPQHRALGRSETARLYGLSSIDEAREYQQHALLGPRLKQCCEWVLEANATSAEAIFGPLDDLKLRSSMTLFAAAVPSEPAFAKVLERYYDGQPDPLTLALL